MGSQWFLGQSSCSKPLRKWMWYRTIYVQLKVDKSLMQIRGGGHLSLRRVIMYSSGLPRHQVLGELSGRGSWLLDSSGHTKLRGGSDKQLMRLPCHLIWQIYTTSSMYHSWGSTLQTLLMYWNRTMFRCAKIWLWGLDRWEFWILKSNSLEGRRFGLWRSSRTRQPMRWLGRWKTSWGSHILTCLLVSSLFRGRKISRWGECKIHII